MSIEIYYIYIEMSFSQFEFSYDLRGKGIAKNTYKRGEI
jgi:hypothetical protein